jgi:hypothetical protein
LGAKHIVFLDNDSSDGTVAAASRYDNVTVLQTKLPFAAFGFKTQVGMRQYLIDRFGKDRWSLCVDIDELFDYPYSDVIDLKSLLGYLNSKSYSAVTSHMLDMFPNEPLAGRTGEAEEFSKEQHTFYDLSNLRRIKREDYERFPQSQRILRNNDLESDEIDCFKGGIRETLFGVASWLTKYPLVFSDGKVIPLPPHGIHNSSICGL